MTDVLKTPEKKWLRQVLVSAALVTLEKEGWKVGRETGGVKGRVRQITKGGNAHVAAIRTSQDGWIAFPRNKTDTKWVTLSDVDVVVAASVDDPAQPKFAQVHIFDASELRLRFDRAYSARRAAGHSITLGRGIWVSLYLRESDDPVNRVGAGIGLDDPPVARVPLSGYASPDGSRAPAMPASEAADTGSNGRLEPLTIAEAKARLARTLGVDPASIKITVEA